DDRFRTRERLGVGRPAFHAAQSRQAEENLVVPPVTSALGREALVQQFYLPAGRLGGQRDVHRGTADVAVPLRDLVGQVELITENGGNDLGDGPVILMRVGR